MDGWVRALFLGLVLMGSAVVAGAQAQAPPPAPGDGPIYSVIYVEVMPTSKAAALDLLKRYREAARTEDGNLRGEVVQRIGQPHQFAVLEIWRDLRAFEAHGQGGNATGMRAKIVAIRNAPTDERVHTGLSVGPLASRPAADAIYVVTHVDVIPPRKDDGVAAVKELGDDSRGQDGNVRFEVLQQTNRPNHFTVVEIWKDGKALEAHSMAASTRRFRDKLAPVTGALYDERMYKAID
jgi:quinol monooxygenase YgiN